MAAPLLICLSGAGATVRLGTAITLLWTHSVQKTEWAEDWRASAEGLTLTEMRIEGSGAGMEPPPDAVLQGDRYVAHPKATPLPSLALRRSGATADYRICVEGRCTQMSDLLPAGADPVTLSVCP